MNNDVEGEVVESKTNTCNLNPDTTILPEKRKDFNSAKYLFISWRLSWLFNHIRPLKTDESETICPTNLLIVI